MTDEAEDYLQNLSEKTELAVICVGGKPHSGKSTFINRCLLDTSENIFKCGVAKKKSQTKGIWILEHISNADNSAFP